MGIDESVSEPKSNIDIILDAFKEEVVDKLSDKFKKEGYHLSYSIETIKGTRAMTIHPHYIPLKRQKRKSDILEPEKIPEELKSLIPRTWDYNNETLQVYLKTDNKEGRKYASEFVNSEGKK